jgi:hypothetical protein
VYSIATSGSRFSRIIAAQRSTAATREGKFGAKRTEGFVMSGWRPLIKGYFGVALVVGAVMSSAFCAENRIRWP